MNNVLLIVLGILIVVFLVYVFRKRTDNEETDELVYNLEELTGFCENYIQEEVSTEDLRGSNEEYKKREERKRELRKALRTCMLGDRSNKLYVKSYLRDGMSKVYDFTDENLEKIIPFSKPERLTRKEKFDILLYHFGKEHGAGAFAEMVKKYNLNRYRELPYIPQKGNKKPVKGYAIMKEDIDMIFGMEDIELSVNDKIEIVVQRVYESFKGLSVIDELRDMDIDGVRGGTSGIPADISYTIDLEEYDIGKADIPRSYDAIWCFFKGVSMHLEFLSFGSQRELERVCQIIYTYDSPGQMDQQTGHKINEMADQSRVVVVGPKFADSWAFFVRKFDASMANLEDLWRDPGCEILIEWAEYMAKGAVTTAITGQQGTGKTMLMKAAVANIYQNLTLRIQEGGSFELWLRMAYPFGRDVTTFRETSKMSGSDGLVVMKKTDGAVTMVGEVADDGVFSLVLKAAKVASLFTWYTHHAQTARGLIDAARDAMTLTGQFTDSSHAEKYVVSVMKMNVHLENVHGHRYCERVTEYIPLFDTIEYDETFLKYLDTDPVKALAWFAKVQYQEILNREMPLYKTSNIIEFKDGRYQPANRPSDELIKNMKKNMHPEDIGRFEEFLAKHWGEKTA